MDFAADTVSFNDAKDAAENFRVYGPSFFDIARLLFLYIAYQRERKQDSARAQQRYIAYLIEMESTFRHKDFWAMGVNYFMARLKNDDGLREFGLLDLNLGNY